MSKSFFITGNRVVFIANADGGDLRYRAASHTIPAQVQVPVRVNERSETVIVVEQGMLEFMIGGAAGHIGAGGFVRVPKGVAFGYRNAGDEPAHLLSRNISPCKTVRRVTIEIAA